MKYSAISLIEKLVASRNLTQAEAVFLIESLQQEGREKEIELLHSLARETQSKHFGRGIYKRGLIEISSYCKNDCYYCGIRASNANAMRYRLSDEEILHACREGYELGFRTFVLQGGEDPMFDEEHVSKIISKIKIEFADCALTLSLGEAPRRALARWRAAGADRYLLRHETADPNHYARLHPLSMDAVRRQRCLRDIKELGYQTGTGFMVGSPYQTAAQLAGDLAFIRELNPEMVGIGPFIPHKDTIFKDYPAGSTELTLIMISILRLMLPDALIPATTALGTASPDGRERGILAGANVVMPNLTPVKYRSAYMLYDGKICTGEEAAECSGCLSLRLDNIGYELLTSRGDYSHAATPE